MATVSSSRARRLLPAVLVTAVAAATVFTVTSANSAGSIEGYPQYEGQTTCSPDPKTGTLKLQAYLLKRYPDTGMFPIGRACDAGGRSEHKEGRAIDWKLNRFNAGQHASAQHFLAQLMATDDAGNQYALARRMGVMYVIYDRRIFGFYGPNRSWAPYNGASPHTDHVHISLTRTGAAGQTSWYTGRSATPAPSQAPVAADPLGYVDDVRAAGPGVFRVAGWALDQNAPTRTTDVHIYVDGKGYGAFRADKARPDVAKAYPRTGGNHGFVERVNAARGQHVICIFAINLGPGQHRLMKCTTVGA